MSHGPMGAIALAALMMTATIPAWAADADPVVATVNGKAIHRSAVIKAEDAISQHGQVPLEKVYDRLLDQLITEQLVLQQAEKEKLEHDPQFKADMAEARLQVLQRLYLTRRVDADIPESAVRHRYDETVAKAPPKEEVRIRHILVADEATAKAVIAALKSGASFADEAKAKSLDPSGKASGGDLGYVSRDRLVPEFADAAFKLKPGEYTQTPVHSPYGWHIIEVEDRRVAPPPSFDKVKGQIRMELAQDDIKKLIGELHENAQIKRYNLDGSPMSEKPKH